MDASWNQAPKKFRNLHDKSMLAWWGPQLACGNFWEPKLIESRRRDKKRHKKEHLHIPWILLEEPELLLQEPEQKTKQIIPSLIKYSPRTHGIIKLERLGRTWPRMLDGRHLDYENDHRQTSETDLVIIGQIWANIPSQRTRTFSTTCHYENFREFIMCIHVYVYTRNQLDGLLKIPHFPWFSQPLKAPRLVFPFADDESSSRRPPRAHCTRNRSLVGFASGF